MSGEQIDWWGWNLNITLDGVLTFKSVLLNGGHGAALAKWHGQLLGNRQRKFVKECLPSRYHRPQLYVYMADFWPLRFISSSTTLVCINNLNKHEVFCLSYDGNEWEGIWREQEKGKGREILHLIWKIVFVEDGRKILTSNVFSGLRVLQRDENSL